MTTPPLDPSRARLISGFGPRMERGTMGFHAGIDLAAARGEPVRAVRDGRVLVSAPTGQLRGYGNVIVIEHSTGEATLYAHLDRRDVPRGAYVTENQQIGTVGTTAGTPEDPSRQTGAPHLHFELLRHWPPPGIDAGRLDPTRLWPPAIEQPPNKRPRRPPQPAQPDRPPPSAKAGQGAAAALIVLAILACSRR